MKKWTFRLAWPVLLLALLDCRGAPAGEPASSEQVDDGPALQEGVVTLRFTDGEKPLAVCMELNDPQGRSVLQLGAKERVMADGTAIFRLPFGQYRLTVSAGPRLTVWKSLLFVGAGVAEHEVRLEPFYPLQGRYWLFDPYVEARDSGGPISLEAILLSARASGLDGAGVAGLGSLVDASGVPFSMSGGSLDLQEALDRAAADGTVFLDAEREPGQPFMYCLRSRPVVRADERIPEEDRGSPKELVSLPADTPFTVWSFGSRLFSEGGRKAWARAASAFVYATVAGPLYDALDLTGGAFPEEIWFFLLNRGYRPIALGGGPGSEADPIPLPGCYVPVPERPGAEGFLDKLREGNAIVSNGPVILFTLGGVSPGQAIEPSYDYRQLVLSVFSSSAHDDSIADVEVIYNGRVIRKIWEGRESQDMRQIQGELPLTLSMPGWVALRYLSALSPEHRALTNPVFIAGAGTEMPHPPATRVRLSALRSGRAVPFLVEIWNRGARVERRSISAAEAVLTLPCTAVLRIFSAENALERTVSLAEATGAAAFAERLEGMPLEDLQRALLSPETYEQMRAILEEAVIEAILREEGAD
ncbi:MAG: hypothetical protein V1918_06940 [Planctomycetota bacterium]